jgi:hypothetical protein
LAIAADCVWLGFLSVSGGSYRKVQAGCDWKFSGSYLSVVRVDDAKALYGELSTECQQRFSMEFLRLFDPPVSL